MIDRRHVLAGAAGAALLGTVGAARAQQVVALATTQGGATGQIAIAIAQVVSQHGGLQMRPQAVANTAQYIPPINAGQMEFGIANAPQTSYAFTGTGISAGQPSPNLRMVGALFPFNVGLAVSKASGMKAYADLRGKRLPWYQENSLGDFIMRACLEAGGLAPSDVTRVPMANFPRQFEAFKAGQIDTTIATVASQNMIEFEQTVPGGVKFLSLKPGDGPIMARWLPGTALRTMPVTPANLGIAADTLVFAYAYTLFCHAGVADETVARVARVMAGRADDLRATGPLWEEYTPADLARDIGVPFHPAATRVYREAGIVKG